MAETVPVASVGVGAAQRWPDHLNNVGYGSTRNIPI